MAFVKVSVHFHLETGDALLQKCGLEKGGRVQKAIDNAVIRHAIPYCPMDTGTLARSPYSKYTRQGGISRTVCSISILR